MSPGEEAMTRSNQAEQLTAADRESQQSALESYERIPYQTNPWTSSRPEQLECHARLHGIEAAPADDCRLLELGCGDGGNIIPLAVAHGRSTFVGVDLAQVHIDAGAALIETLGLDNLRLAAGSFVDFEDPGGPFDYIIAHGLMSWVTPHLQELLFSTCKRLLARDGVAFISYNTYPGWYMQHSIRELLHHHNRGIDDGEVALERSRRLLDVLIQTVPERESAYRDYLEAIGAVARNPDRKYYFAHEYLEDENHPFYVRDFIERAGQGTVCSTWPTPTRSTSSSTTCPKPPAKSARRARRRAAPSGSRCWTSRSIGSFARACSATTTASSSRRRTSAARPRCTSIRNFDPARPNRTSQDRRRSSSTIGTAARSRWISLS